MASIGLLLAVVATLSLLCCGSPIGNVLDCYNADFRFDPTDWDKAIDKGEHPRLHLAKVWTSSRPPKLPVTVVTHTQTNRDKHINQCRTWRGPLVASVYMPIAQSGGTKLGELQQQQVQDTIEELDMLHAKIEADDRCQLTMLLFWEVFANPKDMWLYPHNSLRNLALLQVRTPMLSMVDVDLLLSASLYRELLNPEVMATTTALLEAKNVIGFAAFEPKNKERSAMHRGRRLVAQAVAGGKEQVVQMLEQGTLMKFLDDVFPPAQNVTDYDRWFAATEHYAVPYVWHYEPWFLINRNNNPFYDIRYRGYFFDKVLHASHLNHTGYTFMIHPSAFIVHRPHPVSKIRSSKTLFDALFAVMFARSEVALQEMASGTYQPTIDAATARCAKELPWLLDSNYDYMDPNNWGPTSV